MLYPVLSEFIKFPLLGYILNTIYYSMILAAICVSVGLLYKQLARAGYLKSRLRVFIIITLVMVFPLGLISSRAANMFYHPPGMWSASFFLEQFLSAPLQTFHASLVLPLLFLIFMAWFFRFSVIRVMDTLFLCVPLGHAIGRVGCLLVGCCWGHTVTLSVLGKICIFHNPVPLYSIILNLLLFFLLRKRYDRIYATGNSLNYRGMIVSGYLMGYGVIRFVLETIRNEKIVAKNMTLAQWSMGLLIMTGLILMILIHVIHHARKINKTNP